ncbi:methyltransferase domain-containing protein [Heliobacterium undosum]|uniref:Methyltransferase domain-containing protein n=1 Tax=Heliomicrobium undosum TaxID=121734 RepID=A0A845L363_9FIRM|nr:methyltransferase domain-containing protein [Heliomicrobium undosum]MZP29455.1 methyltransferase domain-containing protein [Heliomicrobium undosum]
MSKDDLRRWSYHAHGAHYREYAIGEMREHAQSWLDFDTVGSWYDWRMYRHLDPLLQSDRQACWLTVGDGRYGLDAHYIVKRGGKAVASDISGDLLEQGRQMGLITDYVAQNAEKMTFADDSFDYVFCKESYHHFPRPMLALYEMLRVARKAVVLIEPLDPVIPEPLLSSRRIDREDRRFPKLSARARRIQQQERSQRNSFETMGNYVYTLSAREIEKVAIGMGLPAVAIKPFHNCYLRGIEYEKKSRSSKLLRRLRGKNLLRNIISRFGLLPYPMASMILFKEAPRDETLRELREKGYQVTPMPESPLLGIVKALPRLQGKRVVIFGAGSFGQQMLGILKLFQVDAQAFIDNDPTKRGVTVMGIPIEEPASLGRGDYVFIASTWGEAIREQLTGLGFTEEDVTLCRLWD